MAKSYVGKWFITRSRTASFASNSRIPKTSESNEAVRLATQLGPLGLLGTGRRVTGTFLTTAQFFDKEEDWVEPDHRPFGSDVVLTTCPEYTLRRLVAKGGTELPARRF